jgi:hypothetical protein
MRLKWPNNPSSFWLEIVEADFLGALERGELGVLFAARGLRFE